MSSHSTPDDGVRGLRTPPSEAPEVRSDAPDPEEDLSRFGGLSGISIRRPVFTAMVMIGLVVLGIFSYGGLAIDQYPDVDIPIVTVQTVYAGASPETIEREVTQRLEEAFNPVAGVDKVTSTSLEGVSVVTVEFDLGTNVDQASQDIRAKIDGVRRELPSDIENPVVQKFDPSSQPIVSLSLSSSSATISDLTTLADEDVRRRLESVSGVGEVRVAGGLAREIRVDLNPERLQAVGVTVAQVTGALRAQNLESPAGRVERGNREQLVRVTGRIENPAEFANIVVANRNGTPIRLGEVATVTDATEEERSVALVSGERAVALDVLKVSGANTVEVAEQTIEAVDEIQAEMPAGVQLQVISDNSVTIRKSVEDVIFELLLGGALTIIIVMLFLNDFKATAITSLALPVSIISAFILMNVLGFTLNILTLMALSLSIGILIDDAIVVIENIVRHRQMGEGRFTAAGEGTQEIFLAVMATTLAIVAVFVPVAFMGGIIGKFFFQFGVTVAGAVLVSLFVSFTLTPMLAAHWGVEPHDPADGADSKNPITRVISRFNRWFDRGAEKYYGLIGWALGHRKTVLALAAASFVGAILLFPLIGGAFMPEQDESQLSVQFETPDGSSLAFTRSKAEQIDALIRTRPEVAFTYTTVGAGATGTVTNGNVFVKLVPGADRELSQAEFAPVLRDVLQPVFGVQLSVLAAGGLGGAVAPIQVEVRGPDVAGLQALADQVQAAVTETPGIVDVQNSLGQPRPEYRIDVNRDVANELGLDIGSIAATVRPILAGETVTTWEDPTGEERDVVVQVAAAQRRSVEDIARIPVATSGQTDGGGTVTIPLSQVATIREGTAPSQINRNDLSRVATISAATIPGLSVSEASAAITERTDALDVPEGYTISQGGESADFAETAGYVLQAIALAIILIFLILASQFESFTQPFAIMLTLPLSLVGVLLALLLTGDTLNMMSMIGVILLFGLVVKNAILIVDNINEKRAQGLERATAVMEAGQTRLRPIVMTTLAMIAGMFPIALALGEGGGFRAPMARAVIGGLITSTLLTLLVVPVAYTYLDDFGDWVKRKVGRTAEDTADVPAEAPAAPAAEPAFEPHGGLRPAAG